MIKLSDFRFKTRARKTNELTASDEAYLSPIFVENGKKNHALLLLHGFAATPAVYRWMIPQLSGYDAIHAPLLPGHGQNLDDFSQIKAADWFRASAEALTLLLENHQKVDVLGLSLGGLLACRLAETFRFHHLYLLAPALALKHNTRISLRLTKVLHQLGFSAFCNIGGNLINPTEAELSFKLLPLATVQELLQFINAYQWLPPQMPTDIFLGAHDRVIDNQKIARKTESWTDRNIHWLKNSAHVLPLDHDRAKIIACMQDEIH